MGRSFRDLIAWQKSVAFVTRIYASTQSFPQQNNARGSLAEIETQLQIAQNLGYLKPDQGESLLASAEEVGRLVTGLMASIKDRAA